MASILPAMTAVCVVAVISCCATVRAGEREREAIPEGYFAREALINAAKAIQREDFRLFWDGARNRFFGGEQYIAVERAATPEEEDGLRQKKVENSSNGGGGFIFEDYVHFWIDVDGKHYSAHLREAIPVNKGLLAPIVPFPVERFKNYSLMGVGYFERPSAVTREGVAVYEKVIDYLQAQGDAEKVAHLREELRKYRYERRKEDIGKVPWQTHAPAGWGGDMMYSREYMENYNNAIVKHLLFASPIAQECSTNDSVQHHFLEEEKP